MKIEKKYIVVVSLLVILVAFTAIFIKNNCRNTTGAPTAVKNEIGNSSDVKQKIPAETVEKEIAEKPKKKLNFKTNEEIREEYGRIETIYLKNGEVYTGAIITGNNTFTIITVNGTIKIPMKDIRRREIIR